MRPFSFHRLLLAAAVLLLAGTAYGQTPQDGANSTQADRLFVRALTEAYLGDHERATDLLTQVLGMRPEEPAVLAALAESYEALDQPAEALLYAERAVAASPTEPNYVSLLASAQTRLGQADEAIGTYEALLDLTPGNLDARYALARLHERTGRYREALATYDDLIDRAGEDPALRLRMEAIYSRLGETETALTMLEAATEAFPAERMLWTRLGMAYRESARDADALEAFRRLYALDTTDEQAISFLATQLEDMGRAEEARALRASPPSTAQDGDLREAATLYAQADEDPAAAARAREILSVLAEADDVEPEALFMLGDLAYRDKDYGTARTVLERGLEVDPRNLMAWEQATASALYHGDPDGALDTVSEALILFPGQIPLLRLKAYAHAKGGDPAAAIRPLDEALAILSEEQPTTPNVQIRILAFKGALLAESGDDTEAFATFDEALTLDPDHPLTLNNYAYILAEAETRLTEALPMAERAVALDPTNPYFLDTLGWVLYKMNRLSDAAQVIEQAIGYNDEFAVLYEHLGDVYKAMGNNAAARTAWQRAAELDPSNEAVQEKLQGS